MTLESIKAQMQAVTDSAKQQMDLNKTMLTNQLDAADRLTLRNSADAVVQLAKTMALVKPDPTI